MTRKFAETLILSLFIVAFLAVSVFGLSLADKNKNRIIPTDLHKTYPKAKLAGGDFFPNDPNASDFNPGMRLGFDGGRGVIPPGPAVGIQIGLTTYDYQHNSRMARQVAWRTSQEIHFAWMKKNNDIPGGFRVTSYNVWNDEGDLEWSAVTNLGGVNVHSTAERSGYNGLDVCDDGRGMVYNHYDPSGSGDAYRPYAWFDDAVVHGNLTPFQSGPPDTALDTSMAGTGQFIWPYACLQYDGSTQILHLLGRESSDQDADQMRYFRRVGPYAPTEPPVYWEFMNVDTTPTIGQVVEASQVSGNVALVWPAHWAGDGGYESQTPGSIGLLIEQNSQDIFYWKSDDYGETWLNQACVAGEGRGNITQIDSTVGGWVTLGDISALYDSDDRLHVVWAARQCVGDGTSQDVVDMEWPLFPYASKIMHWTDAYPGTEYITPVKDGVWDWIAASETDTMCWGGAWHSTSLNQPMIAECADKLYVIFSQFNDPDQGVWDNCHLRNWTAFDYAGSANGLLFMSVSTMANGGLNWDPARALTGYTQRCDTAGGESPTLCESHFWHSVAREGMLVTTGVFDNADIVDPGGDSATADYFLDVSYVNDKDPGGVIQGEGGWTENPFKWFRIPCYAPQSVPILSYSPVGIYLPAWAKPSVIVDTTIVLTNIGNMGLTITSATVEKLTHDGLDWLGHDLPASHVITEQVPNNYYDMTLTINKGGVIGSGLTPTVLEGRIIFDSDTPGQYDTLNIEFIVADTVQFPEYDTLFTQQVSLTFSNHGNMGAGSNDTLGQMDFNGDIECDDCYRGAHNKSHAYLYEASPYVARIVAGDSVVSAGIHNMSWLSRFDNGFRPQVGMPGDGSDARWNYQKSGVFYTADSAIGMECEYRWPTNVDTATSFVMQVVKVFNRTDATINNVYVGEIADWDIPSDSLARNLSYYDDTRKMMYMWGAETPTQPDTVCNGQNDCADADLRAGGTAYILGKHLEDSSGTLIFKKASGFPKGMFTDRVKVWMHDFDGHLQGGMLIKKLSSFSGYEAWTAESVTGPESLYQDLVMFTAYDKYNLGVNDTLTFMKFIASEYQDSVPGLKATMDMAYAYLVLKQADPLFSKKDNTCCELWGLAGDCNVDGKIDILDILFLIKYKYKNGTEIRWPNGVEGIPGKGTENNPGHCLALMNVNNDNNIDILDILLLIKYKYKAGAAPTCPTP